MRGTPEEKPIAFLMLRTMQKARYDPSNLGHFGLAAESYTHFTSPIRRYPDLVVHRTLRESRHGGMSEERKGELIDELPEVARHTSERERRADDAERELVQWKKVRFMADKVGDEFEGYVTGVTAFGLYIELVEHFVEGLVHVSTMADDYYRFVDRVHMLRGENKGKVYRLGDRVKVQVVKVDMERRQVDLGLVEILNAVRESEENRGPRRSKAQPRQERAKATRAPKSTAGKQRPGKKRTRRSQATLTAVRSIVIGTAGHIDHGKSALVRALTGTDPDRLKEEQERGITIDLGFAHLQSEGAEGRADGRGPRVRRRARPRAVRQEHARRRRRHRPRDARRRGRRVGDAADARALSHLPAAAGPRGARRPHEERPERSRDAGARAPGGPRARGGVVSRRRARRRGVVAHRRRAGAC